MKQKQIIIFGGSFDPIHQGHIMIVQKILEVLNDVECCYLVPTGNHPESKQYLFSDEARLFLLRIGFGILKEEDKQIISIINKNLVIKENYPLVNICDFEMQQQGKSYTIDTIQHIQSYHPDAKINIIVGADQASKFSQWYRSDEIAQQSRLWFFPRENFVPDKNFDWNEIKEEIVDISSTKIKKKLTNGESLDGLMIPNQVRPFLSFFYNNSKK